MARYVALLRAVNVGGTGKIKMPALRDTFEALGLTEVKTYIASGNVIFNSPLKEAALKKKIGHKLLTQFDLSTSVMIRTHKELVAIAAKIPFKNVNPSYTLITFLDSRPPKNTIDSAKNRRGEEIALGTREIYVHYPDGLSQSKLMLGASKTGTARNLNTTNKLIELSA